MSQPVPYNLQQDCHLFQIKKQDGRGEASCLSDPNDEIGMIHNLTPSTALCGACTEAVPARAAYAGPEGYPVTGQMVLDAAPVLLAAGAAFAGASDALAWCGPLPVMAQAPALASVRVRAEQGMRTDTDRQKVAAMPTLRAGVRPACRLDLREPCWALSDCFPGLLAAAAPASESTCPASGAPGTGCTAPALSAGGLEVAFGGALAALASPCLPLRGLDGASGEPEAAGERSEAAGWLPAGCLAFLDRAGCFVCVCCGCCCAFWASGAALPAMA